MLKTKEDIKVGILGFIILMLVLGVIIFFEDLGIPPINTLIFGVVIAVGIYYFVILYKTKPKTKDEWGMPIKTKSKKSNSLEAAPVKDDLPLFSKEKLLLLYDELLNEDLPDIVKLLKTLTTKFKHLPNEKWYFMEMYLGMLTKKKAIFPYTLAVSKYEIAMKICKKHNFTRGVIFFEFQIKYYKKYIKWKEKYNEDNNITIETW